MSWYNSTTIILDDTSPRIVYNPPGGAWPQITVPASVGAYNDTLTLGEEPGFTYTFTFTGTAIDVYGVVVPYPQTPPSSTYSVDGSPGVTYVAPRLNATTPNVLFFRSPPLEPGNHTLRVSILALNSIYYLDYFLYTPGNTTETIVSKRDTISVQRPSVEGVKEAYTGAPFATSSLSTVSLVIAAMLLYVFFRRRAQRSTKAGAGIGVQMKEVA